MIYLDRIKQLLRVLLGTLIYPPTNPKSITGLELGLDNGGRMHNLVLENQGNTVEMCYNRIK